MYKIAVLGDTISIQGFSFLGLDTFDVQEETDLEEIWGEIIQGEYGVVFVTENLYDKFADLAEKLEEELIPVISVIPKATRLEGLGVELLRKTVEKAVGADVLSER